MNGRDRCSALRWRRSELETHKEDVLGYGGSKPGRMNEIRVVLSPSWQVAANRWCGASPSRVLAHNGRRSGDCETKEAARPRHDGASLKRPNGSRLSCGALKKNSFLNLRAPPASSAC